ncbi:hypothetical protein [Natrinema sp. 74]|uniref:hypothetical protein n=1 Tax=Natrinema sp. 74 TaxID=3384159 RepID=UPI0038D4615F
MSQDFYTGRDPPARVYVDDVEIPVINKGVETQARVDGPMDINKISDVYFPVEWQGENIAKKIDAYAPNNGDTNVWEPVDVKLLDPTTGEYVTYHRGFSMAYGAGSKETLERRLRVGDPGMLLNNTPFTESYSRGATIGDILNDVIKKFNNHQDVFNVVDVAHIDERVFESDVRGGSGGGLNISLGIDLTAQALGDFFTGSGKKQFKSNRDTLQDAMDFITSRLNGEIYFTNSGTNPSDISLVYDEDRNREFHPKHTGNESGPTVIKNNSLYEIQPINSVEVRGSTSRGVLDDLTDIIDNDGNEYPVATARHKRLYELAGSEYKPPIKEPPNVNNISDAEDYARETLIKEIEGGGMGEIILYQFPHIEPHDLISSQPACGQNVAQNVEPITYSVEEVTQRVGYEGDQFLRRTHLRVNTEVTNNNIEIVDSGTEAL